MLENIVCCFPFTIYNGFSYPLLIIKIKLQYFYDCKARKIVEGEPNRVHQKKYLKITEKSIRNKVMKMSNVFLNYLFVFSL